MITLKQFMETCGYRITEGSDYGWQCFGYDAYRLDSWNGDQDGHTLSIVFDTKTQTVYQVEAFDYKRERAYRMTNPDFKSAFDAEFENRDILDMAWEKDDGSPVKYIDLEVDQDFLDKAHAICNDQEYDTRVQISVDLDDDTLFQMMKLAHERDITFNQLVEIALQEAIDYHRMLNDIDMREEYDFSKGRRGPVIQDPPVPPDSFTQEEAREAVRKAHGKMKKGKK